MSRVDELIVELCPDGVEFKALGEILKIKNGKDHKNLADGNVPVYGSGGIMRHVDTAAAIGPSVLIPRKGSLGNLFYVEGPFWVVDTIFRTEIDSEKLEPRFLFHQLQTMGLGEMNQAGGVPSQTQSVLNALRVPVPPLAIQREIVRILDTFSALEAELEAELEARRMQHSYYRDTLLTFNEQRTTNNEQLIPHIPMGDVAVIGTGSRNTIDAVEDGRYPFYVRSQTPLTSHKFSFDETAIITAGDGVGVGKVFHYVEGKYDLHQRAYRIRVTSELVMPRFLFHLIRHDFARYLASTAVHASVTSLRKAMFENYLVPVPPLAEQERIASILDHFDALVNDLSIGLPAELAARRKQYEYYRDCLLTFQERPA